MKTATLLLLTVSSIFSLGFGLLLVVKPLKAIKFQIKFYQLINWKIEPISMSKEIRNTRIMGGFLILFTLLAAAYILIQRPWR